ncbi:MinD/ParA family protein [Paenibacillus sp. F411]|uniref:MinD/ParA family protein n=1 Tax=Paenibacillus sp. F411 TaxID=2820239 RepID=UPI001AAF6380|nr:MinD/ParA family protein [Paenibacillus sp. F411]MBO2945737.1 MinD/ParA family protein [Paenibacillus sp. F411]
MSDQAEALRQLATSQASADMTAVPRSARFITVCSGKGGVGKSNFTLNFALALQQLGKKVLIFDADLGMANIDVLMGVSSRYNVYHVLRQEKSLAEVIHHGPYGLPFIAGGSGIADMFAMTDKDVSRFIQQMEALASDLDYILFDTGAGLSRENINFITAADQCLVVTTPEPTSVTDAYALIKVVHNNHPEVPFTLMINRAGDAQEAQETSSKIILTAKRFLQLDISLLGYVRDDQSVSRSVKRQVPFLVGFPKSEASRDIERLAANYAAVPFKDSGAVHKGVKGFMQRFLKRK